MLLGIKCYQFVRNDDVRRLTKQPKLTAIIQSHRLTLFGHIMRMDDNVDAKRILLASSLADWRRQLGRPRIMWLSTVQQDLKQHHPRSSRFGSEPPSVEDDVDVWRYAIVSCMPETMTLHTAHCRRGLFLDVEAKTDNANSTKLSSGRDTRSSAVAERLCHALCRRKFC